MKMKRIITIIAVLAACVSATSCYEDFIDDYKFSAVYFASQKPLRTVIADRDMLIKVGVTIGGKREVDTNDWADFTIDESLLEGTAFTAMPEEYYELSHPSRMNVSKANLPIADVAISFTDAFYNDEKAIGKHYAIPFKLVDSSTDSLLQDKTTSIVAVKYISTWHGTYYVKGQVKAAGEDKATVYSNPDLSKNITRDLTTVSRNVLIRNGVANTTAANEKIRLTFNENGTVTVDTAEGGIAVTGGTSTWEESGDRIVIKLAYSYEKGGVTYEVAEELHRRQDPLNDLIFEEW